MANALSSSADGKAAIIDGRAVAARVIDRVAEETRRLKAETGVAPGLAVVLVGDDPASRVYVGAKGRKAEELGFHSVQQSLPAETDEATLLALIDELNRRSGGPRHPGPAAAAGAYRRARVIEAVRPEKDVDGLPPGQCRPAAGGYRRRDRSLHARRLHDPAS